MRRPRRGRVRHARRTAGTAPRAGRGSPATRSGPGPVGPRRRRNAHHPVVVGEDHIAGAYALPAHRHGHIDGSGRGLDGALRAHGRRPHGEAHRAQFGGVAHPGVDDQAADAAVVERGGEELAEHAVRGRRGGGDDEDVALGALLDRRVDHQVVAGPAQRRDRGARDAYVLLDGAQPGAEASGAAHGLVHRGHAIRSRASTCSAPARGGSVTITPAGRAAAGASSALPCVIADLSLLDRSATHPAARAPRHVVTASTPVLRSRRRSHW